MSASSSEEGSGMAGHYATSSGLESTGSLLFSLPSDSSDVQTEITPPTSPALCEGKIHTPRDILDASRRLGQISALAAQEVVAPTKRPKQFDHCALSEAVANDEAGYDADGDGDGDGDGDKVTRAGAGTSATTRAVRRPVFLRIDTRQHRRVASMLATRHPSPGFRDMDTHTHISHLPRAKLAPLPSIHLKHTAATTTPNVESYELLGRKPRPRAEPVGLGIGFPENHPLRSRAFTMPVPATVSPIDDPGLSTGFEETQERRSEWLLSPTWLTKTMQVGVGVCAPSPVRLALRPTFLEVSPSPIEYLPAAGAGIFRCDDAHGRSEVSALDHGNRHAMGMLGRDAEIERKRYDLARERQLDLSESVVGGRDDHSYQIVLTASPQCAP